MSKTSPADGKNECCSFLVILVFSVSFAIFSSTDRVECFLGGVLFATTASIYLFCANIWAYLQPLLHCQIQQPLATHSYLNLKISKLKFQFLYHISHISYANHRQLVLIILDSTDTEHFQYQRKVYQIALLFLFPNDLVSVLHCLALSGRQD